MEIDQLEPDDTFHWNDWILEVRAPPISGMVPCKVISGPWAPGIWWNFASHIDVRSTEALRNEK